MIRRCNQFDVVLDDQHGITAVHQPLKQQHEVVDVIQVQSRGGFVQNIQRARLLGAAQLPAQLDPLGLSAGQAAGRLSQTQVPKTHFHQECEPARQAGNGVEELHCLTGAQIQHLGDALVPIAHLQDLPPVAAPLTGGAGQQNLLKDAPSHSGHAAAAALGTCPFGRVEAELTRPVAPHLGFGQLRKQTPDVGEEAGIGGRVGARRAAHGTLVDGDDPLQKFRSPALPERQRPSLPTLQTCGENRVHRPPDQAGLPRAGHAGDADQAAQRHSHIHVFQIVAASAQHLQPHATSPSALARGHGGGGSTQVLARGRA